MPPLDFDAVDRPPEPTPGPVSDDLTCEVCGKALSYSGKGRKPKFCDEHKTTRATSGATRGNPKPVDVDRACESLNAVYTGLAFALMPLSQNAAQVWANQLEALDNRNHTFLATNKKLVDRINSGAEKGGTVAFIVSHGVALAPVLIALRIDMANRSAANADVHEFPEPAPSPVDPDAAFH